MYIRNSIHSIKRLVENTPMSTFYEVAILQQYKALRSAPVSMQDTGAPRTTTQHKQRTATISAGAIYGQRHSDDEYGNNGLTMMTKCWTPIMEQKTTGFNSPMGAASFDGNEIPTSVFTEPSGSQHEPYSTGMVHSPATGSTESTPVGTALAATAASAFTAAVSTSDDEPSSTGVWVSAAAFPIGVVWTGAWRARLLFTPLLSAAVSVWGIDERERSLLLPPAPGRRTVASSTGKTSYPRARAILPRAPEGFLKELRRTIRFSACPEQNSTVLVPATPWLGWLTRPRWLHRLLRTSTISSSACPEQNSIVLVPATP